MADIVQKLAGETGLEQSSIQKAIGVILNLLKSHLPEEVYSQVQDKIPDSGQMVEATSETPDAGGLIGAASKIAGQIFGSKLKEGADLVEHVNQLGISPASLVSILSGLYKFLSAHLPPEVMSQIAKSLPNIPGLSLVSEDSAGEASASD